MIRAKGQFTRYDCVAGDKVKTGLRHELCRALKNNDKAKQKQTKQFHPVKPDLFVLDILVGILPFNRMAVW